MPAFLRVKKLVAVLDCPCSERVHWAIYQALAQLCQPVLDARRCLRIGMATDETMFEQTAYRLGQNLVAHATDGGT